MDEAVPKWLIPDKLYDVLKWIGLIACPAAAVFFGTVAQAFGMDSGTSQAVVLTLNAAGTFIGALIGVSSFKARGGDKDDDQE